MQVTYLYHSGFAVDTGDNFLIFDYYRDLPRGAGLSKGVVRPADLAGAQDDGICFSPSPGTISTGGFFLGGRNCRGFVMFCPAISKTERRRR